ncbi:tetratricopeptide repeat protein [Marininema halotolerans]|uniref:Tetratricopeptide repeat-containing protein n=1 Tax=Marininema halotolerans TaxID=1155944 RepID=A0A1I6PWW3_9BACL|nr:hypothetical protein [Marininema halotolerans]SFS44731.1 hypothetical protein SAMN05444972_102193 [Marininema halotolerans]
MNGVETVVNPSDEQEMLHMEAESMMNSRVSECYELANDFVANNQYIEAAAAVEELLMIEPSHREGLVLNVRIQELLGKHEGIQAAYFKMFENYPDRQVAYREFGQFLRLADRIPNQVENQLLNCLAIQPQDGFAHVLLADVYSRTKRVRQALLHLEIAVRYPLEDEGFHDLVVRLLQRFHEEGTDTSMVRLTLVSNVGNRGRSHFKRAMRAQQKGDRTRPALSRMIQRVWFKSRAAK